MPTRGFVTIATGSEKYYKLAVQLLHSYRKYAEDNTPFAIICDRETEESSQFDQIVLMDQASCSYMDKLQLYRYAPFDETIFIDADSLILSDPSGIWEDFSDADDLSCYGCTYPLDSDRAWFTYEGSGKYKGDIEYLIDLHGGIYFLRKGNRCAAIFEKAIELASQYDQYSFRTFAKPADEPVLAMALAIFHSRPCDRPMRVLFVPSYWGKLRVTPAGQLLVCGEKSGAEILHFATQNTDRFLYRYLAQLSGLESPRGGSLGLYLRVWIQSAPKETAAIVRHGGGWLLRKLIPASVITKLKGIL